MHFTHARKPKQIRSDNKLCVITWNDTKYWTDEEREVQKGMESQDVSAHSYQLAQSHLMADKKGPPYRGVTQETSHGGEKQRALSRPRHTDGIGHRRISKLLNVPEDTSSLHHSFGRKSRAMQQIKAEWRDMMCAQSQQRTWCVQARGPGPVRACVWSEAGSQQRTARSAAPPGPLCAQQTSRRQELKTAAAAGTQAAGEDSHHPGDETRPLLFVMTRSLRYWIHIVYYV